MRALALSLCLVRSCGITRLKYINYVTLYLLVLPPPDRGTHQRDRGARKASAQVAHSAFNGQYTGSTQLQFDSSTGTLRPPVPISWESLLYDGTGGPGPVRSLSRCLSSHRSVGNRFPVGAIRDGISGRSVGLPCVCNKPRRGTQRRDSKHRTIYTPQGPPSRCRNCRSIKVVVRKVPANMFFGLGRYRIRGTKLTDYCLPPGSAFGSAFWLTAC